MKKLFTMALTALLMITVALAESTQEIILPEYTEITVEQTVPHEEASGYDSITLTIDDEPIELPFDDTPQYSSIEDGSVQASFYNYSSDGGTLYELYLIFPDIAQPGDVITPEWAALSGEESSVVLIVSDVKAEREEYYFSSVMGGGVYPEMSDFSIEIDRVENDGGTIAFAGRLTATLVALDMSTGETASLLSIPETPFSFTIGEPEQERHDYPLPTALPGDDLRKA